MTDQTETADLLAGGPAIPGVTGGAVESILPPPVKIGLWMNERHQYWHNAIGPRPSVTTILDVIDKGHALARWRGRKVAEAAFELITDKPVTFTSREDFVNWLAAAPDRNRDSAAVQGTAIHRLADMAARGVQIDAGGFELPSGYLPYLRAFDGFLARYGASNIVSSEKAVWSDRDGYAGTYDMLIMIDGELWLVDLKTSKGVYPEFALQLAGYKHAEWIVLPGDPHKYPMPAIQRCGILHLRPDLYTDTGWRLIEYPVTDREYLAFLAALDLYQWRAAYKP